MKKVEILQREKLNLNYGWLKEHFGSPTCQNIDDNFSNFIKNNLINVLKLYIIHANIYKNLRNLQNLYKFHIN